MQIWIYFSKELEDRNKELKNKLVSVEQSCEMVEYKDLLEAGNHPSVLKMVEWADDAWRLYHTLYPFLLFSL